MAAPTLEVRLGRVDKTYRPGDRVTGVVTLISPTPVAHSGLSVRAHGTVKPHADTRGGGGGGGGGGGFVTSSSARPIDLLDTTIEMAPGGKLPGGVPVPFEFTLEALPGRGLAETYHGVYVSVRYTVSASLARSGFMAKPLEAEVEFVAEVPSGDAPRAPAPLDFEIKPDSLENVKKASVSAIPKFLIRGRLSRTACPLDAPFTGEVTVVEGEARIRSIELQLVRVETLGAGEGRGREATEIQNLQVGDGDVCRGLPLPLYMVFPRVFTCPSVVTDTFRVEFEVNVIVAFEDAYSVTENFPITLYRA
jgi:hypothetical protein